MTRIAPLEPPYDDDTDSLLLSMMPPGTPPIGLFRTFAKNHDMAEAMTGWGGYALSKRLSIDLRCREIVIIGTCARNRCEYEWGVHVAFFATRAGLDRDQLRSLTHGSADDPCWTDPAERTLIRAVDALHETSTVDDDLYGELRSHFSEAQILDISLLAGWYRAISYAANVSATPLEPGTPTFDDYASSGPPLP